MEAKEKVYEHIDENIDAHIEAMRRLLMQPSVSQTGEGMWVGGEDFRLGFEGGFESVRSSVQH